VPRNPARPALLLAALALAGCGENAAENVPKAAVAPARPAESESPRPSLVADAKAKPDGAVVAATPGLLAIDTAASKLEFVGSKKVGGSHNGGFKAFTGLFQLADGKPELKGLDVEIDTNSIYSDDEKLTGHLKAKDFFEVAAFPYAKFVTTEITPGGEKGATHTIVGNLTLHGVVKSIKIPAVVKVEGDSASIKSEFALNKNDFGMTYAGPGGVIREDVVVKLDIKAVKKG